jgi:hypothetical protein
VLKEIPRSAQQWQRWSYHHRLSHDIIRQAIQKQGGQNLPDYPLDPISEVDFQGFLERNTLTHQQMNAAINAQGVDLAELDPKDENALVAWVSLHFLEHQTAEQRLKVGS